MLVMAATALIVAALCVCVPWLRLVYYKYAFPRSCDPRDAVKLSQLPGGSRVLLDLFLSSSDPRLRATVVSVWTNERSLTSLYNLCAAMNDSDKSVRNHALVGLKLRADEVENLTHSLASTILVDKTGDVDSLVRLARVLEAASSGEFKLRADAETDVKILQSAVRSWLDLRRRRHTATDPAG